MKKISLLLAVSSLLLFISQKAKAQYVTIPDANFAAWLDANIPSAMVGNQMDTTSAAVTTYTSMTVENLGIANLSGIQYFTSLSYLFCNVNELTSLPPLPGTLTYLDCLDNQLTSLPTLPPSLGTLECDNNPLTSLPALPSTLGTLDCGGEQLTGFTTLPAGLSYFECNGDSLTSLPGLPGALISLECNGNKLTTLPALPGTLTELQCDFNQLVYLPNLPAGLLILACYYNQLVSLPAFPSALQQVLCFNNQLTSLPTLDAALTGIACGNNQLTSLPPLDAALTGIACNNNLLTSLPALPAGLSQLWCYSNQLTSLPALPPGVTDLQCELNNLTSLPALPSVMTLLYCNNNQLTSLPTLPGTLLYLAASTNNITCFPVFPSSLTDSAYFLIYSNPFNCLPNYVGGMNAATLAYPLCGLGNSNTCPVANMDVLVTHITNVTCNGGSNGSAFTIAGGGTPPYTYQWAPGGGNDSIATGLAAGSYTILVTDSNSVTTSATVTITQPVAISISSVISGVNCIASNDGNITAIVSGGVTPYTYSWSNGATTASDTGLVTGNYSLTVTDANGCSASIADSVTTNTLFTAIYASPDTVIIGDSAYLTAYANVGPDTYVWPPGNTTQTIMVTPTVTTHYTCEITTPCGIFFDTITVYVVNCSNTFNEPLCIATIDTATNKAEVIWGRTNSPPSGGYGSYNIYKDTLSAFTFIHSQPLDSLSQFIDPTSFPSDGTESYELSTTDSCGQSALSATHTTIYLTTTSGVNVYILNWTAYVGFTPTVYRIFRGPSMNALVQIDSVSNTVLTFHDTLPPAGSIYLIEAVSPFGVCVPTTHRPGHPSVSLSGSFSNGYNAGAITTGTNKWTMDNGQLKIYPNPSNGLITLSYSSLESENVQINIINELGQIVYKENITVGIGTIGTTGSVTLQLNLSNLASGIYTLRMESNTGITEKKLLIIQR